MASANSDDAKKGTAKSPAKLCFVEREWALGGSAVFAAELGQRLADSNLFEPIGVSLHPVDPNPAFQGMPRYPVKSGGEALKITRGGILTQAYPVLREEIPEALIVTVERMTCELVRHLPAGPRKIGVLHAVDDGAVDLARRYSPFFSMIVSVSRLGLEKLESGELACPVRFIPPGILMPERPVERKGGEVVRLLYLGRLTELSKRARSIVGFAKALEASRIPYEWTVAGDGDEAEYIRQALLEHGVTKTRLVGPVPRTSLAKLFEEHDVIVSTSEREAFPLGLQEAMAHGLVPVAVAAPGRVKEVVAQAKGFLIGVDDAEGFAASIRRLAESPELVAELSGEASNAIGEDLGWKQIAKSWEDLLGEFPVRKVEGESWQANLRILPNLTPLFRGCPQAVTDLTDLVLSRLEKLDVGMARKLRRTGYAIRRKLQRR